MKKLTIGLLIVSLLATFSIIGIAGSDSATTSHAIKVDVNELAALELNDTSKYSSGDGDIQFSLGADNISAGSLPNDLTYTSKSLDYFVLSVNSNTYKIQAGLDSSTASAYDLKVEASDPTSTTGTPGSAQSTITLNSTPADLITGIGSTIATTDLTYTLDFNDLPDSGWETYTVTYTLTTQ